MDIDKIITKAKENDPNTDVDLILKAYNFGKEAHKGQFRKTGEPYFEHCLQTAYNLTYIKADSTTIVAGLLHDTPEDTNVSFKQIKKEFGPEVYQLVKGMTKLEKIRYRGEERYVRNLKRMFLAMAKDLRVILIKFADRLHNLETLEVHPPEKRKRIAKEVLELYVPIAWLLGVWELKWRMEDLCFKHLHPEEYEKIKEKFETQESPKIKKHIQKITQVLNKEFQKTEINYNIIELYKHLYRIFEKTQAQKIRMEDVHDTFAIIITTDSINDCYKILGIIHSLWRPKNDLFQDYIALPKPNGYRSIHTTVFGPDGKLTDFQIKTEQMHKESMYGIAGYWYYQRQQNGLKDRKEEPPKWIQEIFEIQKNALDTYEFVNNIKFNVLKDRIFVFTPKGDLIRLVKNATPVDFAYAVDTEVGNKAVGAVVNSKKVSLNTELKNGDSVRIITKKSQKYPNPKWLKFVKTHKSKIKIKENLPLSKITKIKKMLNPKKTNS